MSLYGALYRAALMPAWEQGVRKRSTLQHLRYLERTQWMSLDELLALQATSLQRLVTHAYQNVPYYRQCFDRNGVHPTDVRHIADLQKLPLLTRQAAQRAGDQRASTAAPFPNLRKSTGGSTPRVRLGRIPPGRSFVALLGEGITSGEAVSTDQDRARPRISSGPLHRLRPPVPQKTGENGGMDPPQAPDRHRVVLPRGGRSRAAHRRQPPSGLGNHPRSLLRGGIARRRPAGLDRSVRAGGLRNLWVPRAYADWLRMRRARRPPHF